MVLPALIARLVEAVRTRLSRDRAARIMARLSPHIRRDIGRHEEQATSRRDEHTRAWML